MTLESRIKKIEVAIKPEDGLVVFVVDNETREADFERQKAAFLAKGGNPKSTFVILIDRFKAYSQTY
jgi:hypothetical protein